jgi:hypothetical protein
MTYVGNEPTIRKNISVQSSGLKSKQNKKPVADKIFHAWCTALFRRMETEFLLRVGGLSTN